MLPDLRGQISKLVLPGPPVIDDEAGELVVRISLTVPVVFRGIVEVFIGDVDLSSQVRGILSRVSVFEDVSSVVWQGLG